mgnify:CR=1 FL=1
MKVLFFELFWVFACLALIVALVIDTRRRRTLGVPALLAIAGLTIFWQEFYADWGAYLLWNAELHALPWGPTPLTTPHKPALNLVSYPVFMCAAFLGMLALLRFAQRHLPSTPLLLLSLITAGPVLVLFNLGTEYVSVAKLGLWTYTQTYGPALHTEAGTMPLVFPNLPFAIFGAVMSWMIASCDDSGRPRVERWMPGLAQAHGWQRESLRALAWALTFNLNYWLFLCTPLIVGRLLFGTPSMLVP